VGARAPTAGPPGLADLFSGGVPTLRSRNNASTSPSDSSTSVSSRPGMCDVVLLLIESVVINMLSLQ